jgi:hypothetical protein
MTDAQEDLQTQSFYGYAKDLLDNFTCSQGFITNVFVPPYNRFQVRNLKAYFSKCAPDALCWE